MTREDAISKAIKLRELAERGEVNEREVAQHMLHDMMERHGITLDDLDDAALPQTLRSPSKFIIRTQGIQARVIELKRVAMWKIKDQALTALLAQVERDLEQVSNYMERHKLTASAGPQKRQRSGERVNDMRRKYL